MITLPLHEGCGRNILVTGVPGCGKSTLVKNLVRSMKKPCTGFYTEEVREKGRRTGFSITTLSGRKGVLACGGSGKGPRIGRYVVNMKDLEEIAVPSIMPESAGEFVVIDEIGKMECLSPLFRKAVLKALDSDRPVIGSIALKGDRFISGIKERADVTLVHVTFENRDKLVDLLE